MAKTTFRLTDAVAKKLARPGLHNDGDGLNLRITETGTKSWMFRFKRTESGKPRAYSMGLGPYPEVSLAQAREAAEAARALLRQGTNPLDHRRQAEESAAAEKPKIVTFDMAAERFISGLEGGWKNAKHRQQWRNTMSSYASPVVGKKDVAAIGTEDVLTILKPIWLTKRETASRVRGRIENILDWAEVNHFRSGKNPATWRNHLRYLLPAQKKRRNVRHHPAMPWRDVPAFMVELRRNGSMSALALQFTILTAVRTSEAIEVNHAEFDLQGREWNIPGPRMKAGIPFRVPLTDEAIIVLQALPHLDGNDFVFPGARRGRPLSNMSMLELLRGIRPGLTVHGFRSSFRDWAAEMTSFPREIVEMCLAHEVGNEVENAYQRSDLLDKRRKVMEAWAKFCGRGAASAAIVPLVRKGAR